MLENGKTVLYVDDDADVRKTAELLLKRAGYVFHQTAGPADALSHLVSHPADVILLDLNFSKGQTSGEEGLSCLRDILRHDPGAVVVVVTGHSGLNIAIEALRSGARDFLMKPWNNARLIEAIENAVATRKPPETGYCDPAILVGSSEPMVRVKAALDRCAALTVPVLVRGEAGSGKSLAATTLHRQSGRANLVHVEAEALTPMHLGDIPNTTLLVENVERLPPAQSAALQAWVARAPRYNSRIIATTTSLTRDLGLERGLTYAISIMDIEMPSLRRRTTDITELAGHFLRVACLQHGFVPKTLSPEAQARLAAYPWVDNVHALRHAIERTVILTPHATISAGDLELAPQDDTLSAPARARLADTEKVHIEEALRRNHFNVSAAAAELGLTRPSLYRRMARHGL